MPILEEIEAIQDEQARKDSQPTPHERGEYAVTIALAVAILIVIAIVLLYGTLPASLYSNCAGFANLKWCR